MRTQRVLAAHPAEQRVAAAEAADAPAACDRNEDLSKQFQSAVAHLRTRPIKQVPFGTAYTEGLVFDMGRVKQVIQSFERLTKELGHSTALGPLRSFGNAFVKAARTKCDQLAYAERLDSEIAYKKWQALNPEERTLLHDRLIKSLSEQSDYFKGKEDLLRFCLRGGEDSQLPCRVHKNTRVRHRIKNAAGHYDPKTNLIEAYEHKDAQWSRVASLVKLGALPNQDSVVRHELTHARQFNSPLRLEFLFRSAVWISARTAAVCSFASFAGAYFLPALNNNSQLLGLGLELGVAGFLCSQVARVWAAYRHGRDLERSMLTEFHAHLGEKFDASFSFFSINATVQWLDEELARSGLYQFPKYFTPDQRVDAAKKLHFLMLAGCPENELHALVRTAEWHFVEKCFPALDTLVVKYAQQLEIRTPGEFDLVYDALLARTQVEGLQLRKDARTLAAKAFDN